MDNSEDRKRIERLLIGNKMRDAIVMIKEKPGTYAVTIDRVFGVKVRERLVENGLVRTETDEIGDRFFAHRSALLQEMLEPDPEYQIKTHLDIPDQNKLIQHNVLAALCPICASPAGQKCRSTKNGRRVNFPHQGRYGAAIYALSVLLALSSK